MSEQPNSEPDWKSLVKAFVSRARDTIADAEKHLKIPVGTLEAASDNDYLAIMKSATTIEPLLHDALESEIKRLRKLKVEHEGAAVLATYVRKNGRFRDKAKLAFDMGLINEPRFKFVCHLQEIRNHYAHHISNLNLSILDIIEKSEMNVDATYAALGLFRFAPDDTREENNSRLRTAIYFSLAQFLADALVVINPPIVPGLLGVMSKHFEKQDDQKS